MRLTLDDEKTLIRTIRANPDSCVVLPAAAYRVDGVVTVTRDNLTWTLPRWLFTKMIGYVPEGKHLKRTCITEGCVSPMHRRIARPERAPHEACPNNHPYTPKTTGEWPNGMRRCLICQQGRNQRKADARGGYAKPKTECAQGHALTKRNTYTWKDKNGRKHRKCRACALVRQRQYRATTTKESR